ncbi:MAG: hypothetical protein GW917_00030 [Bdellovibrionales bacterium]|nr:hypothetical protein [Bdellovibrionales bacterium]
MKTILYFLIVSLLPSSLFAQTVFSVGSKKISASEFQSRYDFVRKNSVNPPSKSQFVQDWVKFEMGVREAYSKNLHKSPEVIQAMEQVLYNALLENQVGERLQKIRIKEAEMKSYYKNNPSVRTSHILISVPEGSASGAVKDAFSRANEVYKLARGKKKFEDLVKLYSDDIPSKETGGDIGYQSRVTLVPEYYEASLKLREGQVSPPIKTRFGFHIIKMIDKRPYSDADKAQIRAAVIDEKRNEIFDSYFKALRKKYPVSIDESVLKKIN